MTDHKRILLVGCGKMGSALLNGWLSRGTPAAHVSVVEPMLPQLPDGVTGCAEAAALGSDYRPSVIVFAVKPQSMDAVLPGYVQYAGPETVFLSIAAGKPIGYFEATLTDGAIVRAMPNTPAAVGRGITVLCANDRVSSQQKAVCTGLMESVGEVAWIDDEALMDAVTGLSGSGPAYVFHLVEAMAAAGEAAGLSKDLAMQLARATVAGSGELLTQSGDPAGTLRENVTSPGGTTAAALEILMGPGGLTQLMTTAIARATDRSRELAQ
ncbi:MAG: pyrroline-5-carboxylate reductase [Alphaproteobacteria bacterium]|nr:pyrroline-5-carboxylate reductase [Alphaproteobacteria bacterium]MCZ6589847.1 pyrroline-5-carboxylate reductase [Alphaproteobacteria bacterium]MCZ6846727.1 pyrroline-5-carboxylate reductase [Alphaproteobacteria bacterium]